MLCRQNVFNKSYSQTMSAKVAINFHPPPLICFTTQLSIPNHFQKFRFCNNRDFQFPGVFAFGRVGYQYFTHSVSLRHAVSGFDFATIRRQVAPQSMASGWREEGKFIYNPIKPLSLRFS